MMSPQEIKKEAQAFLSDGLELVRKEVQLAKAEIGEKVSQLQTGVTSLVASALVGFAGLIFLGHAATAYLVTFTSPVAAALIVALTLIAVSMIMLLVAKANLKASELKPRHTLHAAQKMANEFGGKSDA